MHLTLYVVDELVLLGPLLAHVLALLFDQLLVDVEAVLVHDLFSLAFADEVFNLGVGKCPQV